MRRYCSYSMLVLLITLVGAHAAIARASRPTTRVPLHFTRVALDRSFDLSYDMRIEGLGSTLVVESSATPSAQLIDEHSRASILISAAACPQAASDTSPYSIDSGGSAAGGGLVAFGCQDPAGNTSIARYLVGVGWQPTLPTAQSCQEPSETGYECRFSVDQVGRHWVKVTTTVCLSGEHCGSGDALVRQDEPGAGALRAPLKIGDRRYQDLNLPGLYRPLCFPLRVPRSAEYAEGPSEPGSVQMFGSYGLLQTYDQVEIERCGSHRKHRVFELAGVDGFVADRGMIVTARHRQLTAIRLPDLSRVTALLPKAIYPSPRNLAVTSGHIWFTDLVGRLWTAPIKGLRQ